MNIAGLQTQDRVPKLDIHFAIEEGYFIIAGATSMIRHIIFQFQLIYHSILCLTIDNGILPEPIIVTY